MQIFLIYLDLVEKINPAKIFQLLIIGNYGRKTFDDADKSEYLSLLQSDYHILKELSIQNSYANAFSSF